MVYSVIVVKNTLHKAVFSQGFDIEVATLEVRIANTKFRVFEFWEFTNTSKTKIGVVSRKVAIGCDGRRLILKRLQNPFYFPLFQTHYRTQEQRKIKFERRIKLNKDINLDTITLNSISQFKSQLCASLSL